MDRETVAVAMDTADRFFSNQSSYIAQRALLQCRDYELVVMTSLYLAIKLHERVLFGSDLFAEMSNGVYSVDEIERTEIHILQGLSWRVNAPTSIQMSHHILSLVSSRIRPVRQLDDRTWSDVLDEVRYQSEHAVRDYYFCTHRSSTVAIAAIFNAIELLRREDRSVLMTALLIVLQEFDFAETNDLVAAKNRLLHDVEEMGVAANEDGGIADISADVAQVAVCGIA
ncbi:predicted protein [Thalassiosira pseudonana CCMP1335]|uniref:Cyclin N-terminal domain-containing protein n=1 Tax=Thalassiosira pseudonana TaxID=35128 RepID=B8LDJ1_THAPS|nr:predicted protein [Thalassiosira pseudonana CCMP1335]EED86585.1 predicted protein [Thalassiosira pseudonana CCMP1335]|eukprot:scaffold4998_cov178-Alexandrium_tamarense.AAC.10